MRFCKEVGIILERFNIDEPVKSHAAILKAQGIRGSVLIVLEKSDPKVRLAARNLRQIELAVARDAHAYQLFRYPAVVATKAAMVTLVNRLKTAKAGDKSL